MKNPTLPEDQSLVLFTDMNGVPREGIYKKGSKAFVEAIGDEGPEDTGNIYPEEDIVSWEYLEKRDKPNSDIMVIL
jgi:hypothetical protein